MEKFTKETTALIARDFELDFKGRTFSDEELLQILADHVAYMMERRMDFLLSLMYRLDVLEVNINEVLHPGHPEPANIALAKLIIERQRQRILTKQQYKNGEKEDWMEWDFD